MTLKNSAEKFGFFSKFFHWSIFLLFCIQYYLVYAREYFEDNSELKLNYILLHKSLGVLTLVFVLGFLISSHLGVRPKYPSGVALWEKILSRLVHGGLFLVMFLMPISGMLMSNLSGYGIQFFGFPMYNPFEVNKELAGFFNKAHELISFIIIGLVALHAGAALFHHFIRKDNILKRMLPFVKP